jgi:hypothetical protein
VSPVLGPDGLPVRQARIGIYDGELTYESGYGDGMPVKVSPEQLLMRMARRRRDGASNAALIAEFDLIGEARSPFILARALDRGEQMLAKAIVEGREPAETPPDPTPYVDRDDD